MAANLSLSRNKVKDFTEYIDDYDNGGQKINSYGKTDIAYSPAIVGGTTLNFIPVKNTELSLFNKYVSRQYLDNTNDANRVLRSFFVQDLRGSYTFKRKDKKACCLKEISITAMVNNLWSRKYEPNGYTFSYIAGGSTVTENYYFPMAGRNFMAGVNIKF